MRAGLMLRWVGAFHRASGEKVAGVYVRTYDLFRAVDRARNIHNI